MLNFGADRLARLLLTCSAPFLLAVRTGAQEPAPRATTRFAGVVWSKTGPIEEGRVDLMHGDVSVRTTRTAVTGRFEIDGVPVGEYRLRVLRIGYDRYDQPVALVGPVDSVRIEMADFKALRDSLERADFERRLAEARARPRHWNCRVDAAEVNEAAVATYERYVTGPGKMSELAKEYGMPAARSAFMRDFRGVTSAAECRRLAEALDRQTGLIDDRLRVFRVGKVYFLPDFGEGGMVVGLNGKILTLFVIG